MYDYVKADEWACVAKLVSEKCLIVGGSVVVGDMCVGDIGDELGLE